MSIIERVRASLSALPPAEQRVGQLLLEDPRAFATQPIAVLANLAHTSKPTVVRFCRSLGYDGLSDFKLKLAGSVSEGVPFVHRAVAADDNAREVMVKVLDNTVAAMLRYRNDASTSAFEAAMDALWATARTGGRIEFYGVGNSGIIAADAQHKFFRLGVNTVAYNDSHVQLMAATLLSPGDCGVMISNSGQSQDLLDVADVVRRSGARLIAITASGSPLAQRADVHLAADHMESYDRYSPMVSRLLHLLIIDVLATGVSLRFGPQMQPKFEELRRNLRRRRVKDGDE
jgi:RpiR family carbohydrate utilization transcriptional regulator